MEDTGSYMMVKDILCNYETHVLNCNESGDMGLGLKLNLHFAFISFTLLNSRNRKGKIALCCSNKTVYVKSYAVYDKSVYSYIFRNVWNSIMNKVDYGFCFDILGK